jgi:adenylate kinase family enzyme
MEEYAVKLFILGLPGSGKSTIAREIERRLGNIGSQSIRICDFLILEQIFHDDVEGKQFKPAAKGGFDIIDLMAFDTALNLLERSVKKYNLHAEQERMILIEFARNNYKKAFEQFSQDFLQDAYFVYLSVDQSICKKRIHDRIAHPNTKDDHYVSDYIFDTYYYEDDGLYLSDILEKDYGIETDRVLIMNNNCSLDIASKEINDFVDFIFPSAVQEDTTTLLLSDSEDIQDEKNESSIVKCSEQVGQYDEKRTQVLVTSGSITANL